ncbi:glycosyltransferase family 2 protein [Streptomyces luteolifulvus]|uniref:Glycosyltransferase family 2 protein n=1 Tax=Streptomyces luteolifulvus TaxID=2615112 RepID=A0A6H9USN3_9ACTN|nr:glycosyltransferase family A protein [Streptomyces luteolifulvus]KAB1142398.1 glycosyltransferase family 2 protein [Streptomyces luteolifulvus]
MLNVSVVVPVYNAGPYIDKCADSLLRQTIGPDRYEVIYVDDGSTDGSAERLDRLAALHPHVRVHHQENSGWPGKPRNVGMLMSRGEYVQFVDQDDELGLEALARLYSLARRNTSDIVLGKTAGTMAGPSNVFARTIEKCTVGTHPLFESLTPHKMFRRAFLIDNGIRFPEGRCRLEDQLFMAHAYSVATCVSVLGDYPCYYWMRREDGRNTSGGKLVVDEYFGYLRKVVRTVKAHTPPGPVQDRMLRRTYRVEILRNVGEPYVLSSHPQIKERFEAVRRLVLEEFPPSVRDGLPAVTRLRAHLLERGDHDALRRLAGRTGQLASAAVLGRPRWRDGALIAPVRMHLVHPDGRPLTVLERRGRLLLDPALTEGIDGVEEWETGDLLNAAYGEIRLSQRSRHTGWHPECELSVGLERAGRGRKKPVVSGTMRIDPLTAAGGGPLEPGVYDVTAYFQFLGVGRNAALRGVLKSRPLAGQAVRVGSPSVAVIPYWTARRQLALDVGEFHFRYSDVPRWGALWQHAPVPPRVRRPLGKALRYLRR